MTTDRISTTETRSDDDDEHWVQFDRNVLEAETEGLAVAGARAKCSGVK